MDNTNTKPEGGDGEAAQIGVEKQDLVKMQAPEDVTSVSIRGMQFDIPASGQVECPGSVAAELESHGFTRVIAPRAKARAR